MLKKYITLLLIIGIIFINTACSNANSTATVNAFKLNTFVTITAKGKNVNKTVLNECVQLCDYYDLIFSKTNPDSELYKLNNGQTITPSKELLELVDLGIKYGELTQGSFDITIGSVNKLWDFSGQNNTLPDHNKIKDALQYVNYTNCTTTDNSIILKPGIELDLGALAKGYIADKMKDFLIEKGIENAIINLGGNIYCIGNEKYNIGIQKPFADRSEPALSIKLTNASVVTAGVYERCFFVDDKLYHHILNPKTGYPYNNDLLSVTIISKESKTADALSTSCYTLGLEKGLELINSTPDCYGVFITSDYKIIYSDGLLNNYDVTVVD